MVPLESQIAVQENRSTSVDAKEAVVELPMSKDQNVSATVAGGPSSLTSPKAAQEEANFMGKGGEQQFGYHPSNVHASQPQTLFSGGYLNHLGQWQEYPYVVSAEGLDAAYPVMYGTYSPLSTIGDSQSYFSLLYPLSSPYYQPPASQSTGYSSPTSGVSQIDPMHTYYFPEEAHYSPTHGFYWPFGSFDEVPMHSSGIPGFFGQGKSPLTPGMESISNSGSYKAFQQGGKFGGSTPRWSAANCRSGTFNKGFKNEKGSHDFLNEQSRGPRATKTLKELDSSLAEDRNKKGLLIVDSEKYNRPDFVTEYKDAKFFVIKSYTEDHVHKSIKYSAWASTARGNRKLNTAYREAKEKEDPCPIFLFFSVNSSGQFCGVAEMIGPVDFDKSAHYWQNDRWNGQLPVKWHIVKDVPNSLVRHIILENNDNKRVTNSRDTQEVQLEQGLQMLVIFKNHEAETTILEDFDFYEQREKAMLDDRQQQKLQCSEAGKLAQTSAQVDSVAQISDAFAQAVQLDKSKGKGNKPRIDAAAAEKTAEAGDDLKESG